MTAARCAVLRALAVRLRADADAADALAAEIDTPTPASDDVWIPITARAVVPVVGVRGRVILDAATRGELEVGHVGQRPAVRRSELDRWITSRAVRARQKTTPGAPDDADYAALTRP